MFGNTEGKKRFKLIYVASRQSSFVDLEQFIEAPELPEVERGYERGSVVREVSVAEALAEIEEPEIHEPDPMDLAHQEVSPLVRGQIDRYLQGRVGVSLAELAAVLDRSPVEVLLTAMENHRLVVKHITMFYHQWGQVEIEPSDCCC